MMTDSVTGQNALHSIVYKRENLKLKFLEAQIMFVSTNQIYIYVYTGSSCSVNSISSNSSSSGSNVIIIRCPFRKFN